MIGQLRLNHFSYRTEQTYLEWVSRFAGFLNDGNPLSATDEDAVDFLSDLAVRKQVAGAKDRETTLPATLEEELKAHLERVQCLFEEDQKRKVAGVWLPESEESVGP